jgi:hypothetical protein
MEVAAWTLFRRAAGMENRGALRRRETRQIQFLESGRRHGGDLRPMFDDSRRKTARLRYATARQARFADFPVSGVVFELKREEFEREPVKISEGRVTRAPISAWELGVRSWEFGVKASWNSVLRKNGLAQTRGEV